MSSGRVGLRAEGLALVNETGPSRRAEQKENISIPAGSSLPLFAAWPSTYNGRQIRKYWGLVGRLPRCCWRYEETQDTGLGEGV